MYTITIAIYIYEYIQIYLYIYIYIYVYTMYAHINRVLYINYIVLAIDPFLGRIAIDSFMGRARAHEGSIGIQPKEGSIARAM